MPEKSNRHHVLVIGAGIVGAATAFYLREAGAQVTLVDAQTPSAGATGASDGAVSIASKTPGTMMRLARASRDLYLQLSNNGMLSGLFHTRPTFLFARNEDEISVIQDQASGLEASGERCLFLSRNELIKRIPNLGRKILAGLLVPNDGHAIGYQVVNRFLINANIQTRLNTCVQELTITNGCVTGVETNQGQIKADRVVISAGLGSTSLANLSASLIPRRGQLIVTDRASLTGAAFPGPLMSASYLASKRMHSKGQCPTSLVIDPLNTGQFLIGSSRETGETDTQTDAQTVAAILQDALEAYPDLSRQRVIRTFSGIRVATKDGIPIVGGHPKLKDLFIATGMEGDGICLGPLLGMATAHMTLDLSIDLNLVGLSPARFS